MDDLTKYFSESVKNNLCMEYKNYWSMAHGDKERLMRLALAQQSIPHVATYAYEGKGLTKDYILREFKGYINGHTILDADGVNGFTYGMWVDYHDAFAIDKDVVHMMWCDAPITIPMTKCSILYISNDCDVKVDCQGYNSLKVYLFDVSKVTFTHMGEGAGAIVYQYGKDAQVINLCDAEKVKVFNKELRL